MIDHGQGIPVTVPRANMRSAWLDYLELMKPELTGLSVLTALCGFYLSSSGFALWGFLYTAFGTMLLGGGAGALNQYAERTYDAMMKRTERRPLPAGRLLPKRVLMFGLITSAAGLLILLLGLNMLTALLGLITFSLYVLVYTPFKRKTWLATLIGAIPGALPPVMGYTAGGGSFDVTAGILFLILFLWQIPHFLSLAWMYRKDYSRAGYEMLTVRDEHAAKTSTHSLLYCFALLPATGALALLGKAGLMYALGSLFLGFAFLAFAFLFWRSALSSSPQFSRINLHARLLFFASLVYLPSLFFLLTVDKV